MLGYSDVTPFNVDVWKHLAGFLVSSAIFMNTIPGKKYLGPEAKGE